MTREKEVVIAIEIIENNSELISIPKYAEIVSIFKPLRLVNWLKDYKRLLEQEPVLDKIKTKINGLYRVVLKDTPQNDWAVGWNDCLDEVVGVIDEYRVEKK